MKSRFAVVVCVLLLALAAPLVALAQTGEGRISGVVFDVTGAVVAGAKVTVTNESTGISRSITSSASGTYVFTGLPAGPYSVEVEAAGFKRWLAKGVEVSVGTDRPVNATLEPGAVTEVVEVTGLAVSPQTSEASISGLVDPRTITTLPLNRRNPLHLLGLIPGVVGHSAQATTSSGTVAHFVHGDRGRGILTTLDGIDISDPIIPRGELTNAPVNPDAVEEFRVTTALARAEYGRNAGAQVEMATRRGANDLHGTLYYFVRNTALDANSFFNNHIPDPVTKVAPTEKELLKQHQFGASVGGPIRKNKAFFFFNYEGQRRKQTFIEDSTILTASARQGIFRYVRGTVLGQTRLSPALVDPVTGDLRPGVAVCGGTTTTNCIDTYNMVTNDPRGIGLDPTMQRFIGLWPLPNDFTSGDGLNTARFAWNAPTEAPVDTYTLRVDYQFSEKHELGVRYNLANRNDLIGDFINGALPRTPDPSVMPGRSRLSRNQSAALNFKTVLNPRWLNDFRAGFTRNTIFFADTSHPFSPKYQGDTFFSTIPELRVSTFRSPFVYWGGTERHPEHFQVKDNVTWIKSSHAMRFGVDYRFYRFNNRRGVGSNPQGSGISVGPSVFFTAGVVPFTGTQASTVVANSTDRARLQGMFNELLGIVAQVDQIMYSDGVQYLPGNALILYQRQREAGLFFQDDWRITSRLTLNLGLRYELLGIPYDKGGLQVVPDRPLEQNPVTFLAAGPGTGRKWYTFDRNDFAPSIGFAWDPWGDGKMAVRAGYRIAYNRLVGWALNVLEQRMPAIGVDPQIRGNCMDPGAGTIGACGGSFTQPLRLFELPLHPSITVVNGLPQLAPPSPNVINRTPANNRRESPFFFTDDFKTANVHQFTLSIQRRIAESTMFEVAYVGSRGRNLFRFINANQIDIFSNGFLQDFLNAQTNLAVCRAGLDANSNTINDCIDAQTAAGVSAANRTTSNFANWGLPGQVALPLFSPLFSATNLQTASGFRDSTNVTNLDQNNIGLLVDRIDKSLGGSRGPLAAFANDSFFRPNPQFDVAGYGASISNSWYNGAYAQVTHRAGGMQLMANYTWARSIDDTSNETVGAGTSFDFPFDSTNIRLNRARSNFDVNHVFRAFMIYDLPWGQGRRWGGGWAGWMNQLLGGWQMNTIFDVSSGFPFTVSSGRQTFGYFVTTPADCTATARDLGGVNKSDARGGVWFLSTADKANFSTPAPGRLGSCGRNTFTGPSFFQLDLGIFKTFDIRESWKLDFRAEMFNVTNTANFSGPTTSIQSATFGKITGTGVPNRVVQFALKLHF